MDKDLLYRLSLSGIPGIGPVRARKLIHAFGDPSRIFQAGKSRLEEVEDIGKELAAAIAGFRQFSRIEQEIRFLEKHAIRPLFFQDGDYPHRLLPDEESPIFLFYKGAADLNAGKILSVIGTRRCTSYGASITRSLMSEIRECCPDTIIVSGLAYGIDTHVHTAALENGLPTIAILAHGLDIIYPSQNRALARQMVQAGGLLTRFPSQTDPDRYNFPLRNRLVARMSDATIVIESGARGGSLLTAASAMRFGKSLFAIPGRIHDAASEGCNELIRRGDATLLTHGRQLAEALGWIAPALPPGHLQADHTTPGHPIPRPASSHRASSHQTSPDHASSHQISSHQTPSHHAPFHQASSGHIRATEPGPVQSVRPRPPAIQPELFIRPSDDEKAVLAALGRDYPVSIDTISRISGLSISALAIVLLNLELQGLIIQQPGKGYALP